MAYEMSKMYGGRMMDIQDLLQEVKDALEAKDAEIETWRERALKAESVKTLDVSGMEIEIKKLKHELSCKSKFCLSIIKHREELKEKVLRLKAEIVQLKSPAPASVDKVCHFDGQTYVCLDSCLLGAHEYSTCKFGALWQEPAETHSVHDICWDMIVAQKRHDSDYMDDKIKTGKCPVCGCQEANSYLNRETGVWLYECENCHTCRVGAKEAVR